MKVLRRILVFGGPRSVSLRKSVGGWSSGRLGTSLKATQPASDPAGRSLRVAGTAGTFKVK